MSDSQPAWHRLHLWQLQPLRDLLLLLVVYGLFHLGYVLSTITVPMLLALGLSYLVEPLVSALGRRFAWATRIRVVVALLGALVIALVLLLLLVVPPVVGQAINLVNNSSTLAEKALSLAEHDEVPAALRDRVAEIRKVLGMSLPDAAVSQEDGSELPLEPETKQAPTVVSQPVPASDSGEMDEARIRAIVAEELARRSGSDGGNRASMGSKLFSAAKVLGTAVATITGSVFGFGLGLFLLAFFFVVFSTSWTAVLEFLRGLIPVAQRDRGLSLAAKMDQAVAGFVRGRLTIAMILSGVFALGWTFCGIPYALVLGLVVGIFTLVPYLAGIGLIGAYGLLLVHLVGDAPSDSVYLAAEGGIIWWRLLLFPALVFMLAQLLDDYLLTPMIQGKATNLSMASILVAVMAGGTLAGVYGMLLAIPVAACIKIALTEVMWPQIQAWLKGERKDPMPLGEL